MYQADYQDGGIVNLMTSISLGMGAEPGPYAPARLLGADEIGAARQVVLLIIDGLGELFFRADPGELAGAHRGALSSVFPSATAAAVSSFFTGVAPQQHAVTGWHLYLRELGMVVKSLPFVPRFGGAPLTEWGRSPELMLRRPSLFPRLECQVRQVAPRKIVSSPYNRLATGGVASHAFDDFSQCCAHIVKLARLGGHGGHDRQFISAYWPQLDSLAHQHGIASDVVRRHWRDLRSDIAGLARQLAGSDSLLLVTADHGFIDTRPESVVDLADHPSLAECLALPLCGEPRAAFAYVRPGRCRDFEQYVREVLGEAFELHASEALLAAGWFGLGTPAPQLRERIGDYVLIPKGDHVIHESLGDERGWPGMIGVHGGCSEAEMLVPLLALEC